MSVFVLTSAFDYEGESPRGVFASFDLAKASAERLAEDAGYEPKAWEELCGTSDDRYELQHGPTQWVIREEQVQGFEWDCCESMRRFGRCG